MASVTIGNGLPLTDEQQQALRAAAEALPANWDVRVAADSVKKLIEVTIDIGMPPLLVRSFGFDDVAGTLRWLQNMTYRNLTPKS